MYRSLIRLQRVNITGFSFNSYTFKYHQVLFCYQITLATEQIVLESLLEETTTTVAWVLRIMHKLQVRT